MTLMRRVVMAPALLALSALIALPADHAAAIVQNPAAVAKAAARAAREQTPVDSMVTPAALRALQRLADSANAASAARRTAAAPDRAAAGTSAAKPSAAELGPRAVTEIVVREREVRRELRLVTSTPVRAVLSEPFRTADRARLFLILDSATVTESAAGDAADITKENGIAALMLSEQPTGVRVTIELHELGRYGLETAGDTTIVWLRPLTAINIASGDGAETSAEAAAAGSAANGVDGTAAMSAGGSTEPGPTTPRPTLGDVARSGWTAFREDASFALAAAGAIVVQAGDGLIEGAVIAGRGTASGASRAASWIAARAPLAEVSRMFVLAVLLLSPPALVVLVLRRRRARHEPATVRPAAMKPASAIRVERRWFRLTKSNEAVKAVKAVKAVRPHESGRPRVTRKKEDARLWAARTLAANGTDAAEIARQTGLSRDAALLLVRRTPREKD